MEIEITKEVADKLVDLLKGFEKKNTIPNQIKASLMHSILRKVVPHTSRGEAGFHAGSGETWLTLPIEQIQLVCENVRFEVEKFKKETSSTRDILMIVKVLS